MLEELIQALRKNRQKLVYTEGAEPRILSAASRLQQLDILEPILLGDPAEIKAVAEKRGYAIDGIKIVNPLDFDRIDEMIDKMVELRKGKMDADACAEALKKSNYFGTMYVKMGFADGLLGGATYSTADTVRPALQICKVKPGSKIVSSCCLLVRPGGDGLPEKYVMGDCAINIAPTAEELVEITIATARTAKAAGLDPVVSLLSYSSMGSGKGATVDIAREAAAILKSKNLDFPVDGELQFDAAFAPEVAKIKAPNSPVAGKSNVFIFPNIDTGNIGYKIAQRFGRFEVFGPILQGLNAKINDLSRGCTSEEVYQMSIITAGLDQNAVLH